MASTGYIIKYLEHLIHDNPILKQYHEYLFKKANPNFTGFNMVFMVPPHLSGSISGGSFINTFSKNYSVSSKNLQKITKVDDLYEQDSNLYLTFAAKDYSPPQTQVIHAQISPRTGGIPYASDVTSTENFNITYADNVDCLIYLYHLLWVEYIRAIVSGGFYNSNNRSWTPIKPSSKYLNPSNIYYGTLDYAASIYIVKYKPNMTDISYICKAIGCIPVSLPSKELIGSLSANEIALVPFDYIVGGYREYVMVNGINEWIYDEFKQQILASQPIVI